MFQQHFQRDPGTVSSIKTRDARAGVTLTVPATARIEWPCNSVLQVPPRQRRSRWSTRPARSSTPHLKPVTRSSRALRASSSTMAPVRASCKIRRPTEAHQQRRGQREDPRLVHTQSGLTSRTTREARRKAAHKNGGKDTQLLRRTPPLAQTRLSDKNRRAWNRNFATDSQKIGATKLATTQYAEKASAMNRGRRRPKE